MELSNFVAGLDDDFCPQFTFGVFDEISDNNLSQIDLPTIDFNCIKDGPVPCLPTSSTSSTLDDEIQNFVVNFKSEIYTI